MSILLLIFIGCGKKTKNVVSVKKKPPINILSLPSIQGAKAHRTNKNHIIISWLPITNQDIKNTAFSLVGYNVYRLVNNAIIPKQALTPKPILETFFIDQEIYHVHNHICYVIKPLYKYDDYPIYGIHSNTITPTQ